MKKLLAVLLTLVLCFSVCACGGTSESGSGETTKTSYTGEELLEAAGEEAVVRCSEYLGGHCVPYYGVVDFVEAIQEASPDNIFSQELLARYEAVGVDSKTDFEKDFFEIIPYVMCDGWGQHVATEDDEGFNITPEQFGKAWVVGYTDEKGNEDRAIIVETTGFKWMNYPYVYLLAFDGEYNIMGIDEATLADVYGIDPTAESGKVVNTEGSMGNYSDFCKQVADIEATFNGTEYTMVPADRVDSMIEEYMDFYSLLKLFVDHEYFDYDPYNDQFNVKEEWEKEEILKASEPEIGMTAEEVVMGTWGEPDKKNIDEYEWGTHEQWVYDTLGYVYLENGIVVAIQYR